MQEIYPTNWPVAVDTGDPRNEFHLRALHEARITTEHQNGKASAPAPAAPSGLLGRLRLAITGGALVPTTDACNCPA